ncbi:uncharacterized protein EV420DRAFT_1261149 [Desarmillaria tabescens]|uniref:RRM domain-containing protein n=1 Tax=Armillaria tabescens TaxID=1929756 RepID=A0AA39NIW0_ARMTA|nr:uncharacterized protein EV420DRAFT_1261149 [Desarmillaria tabescens]KAK0466313.1 hypothetical protein EV420DRAFT_1261149 [Desarmillaria tabescens]
MAAALAGLSASVTRILYLSGFPKELKTKDIQSAFSDWEGVSGGFKIKWLDDTSLLIVFQDAPTAKRAYLQTLAFPPRILTSPNGVSASVRPYDGADAQTVIQNVNSRGQHNPNNPSRHNNRSASISVFPNRGSISANTGYRPGNVQNVSIPEFQSQQNGRDQPSPTLPSLPSHPTLNSLISSSLGEAVKNVNPPSDPAILATSLNPDMNGLAGGPRIGNPGKRMLGAALGVRHPALGPRVVNGGSAANGGAKGGVDNVMGDVNRAMGGLVVAE